MPSKRQHRPGSKDERLEVRLTKNEKAAIERRAREAGVVVAEWVRKRIIFDAVKP